MLAPTTIQSEAVITMNNNTQAQRKGTRVRIRVGFRTFTGETMIDSDSTQTVIYEDLFWGWQTARIHWTKMEVL